MVLILKIDDQSCSAKINGSIYVITADAKVDVDLKYQTITVESTVSEESIKQVIVAIDHTI